MNTLKNKYLRFIQFSAIAVIVIGMLVIKYGGLLRFKAINPASFGNLPMATDAGVCFILAGLSLLLHLKYKMLKYRIITTLLEILITTIALLSVIQKLEFGPVSRFLVETIDFGMSIQTAVCFICTAFALYFIESRIKPSQILLHMVTILAFIVIVGYLFDVPELHHFSFGSSMSFYAASTLLLFSVAASLVNPSAGLTGMFTGKSTGSTMSRKIFLQIFVAVFAIGYLHVLDHRHHWFSSELGAALQTISSILVGLLIIWETANPLNKSDEKKKLAEENFKLAVESAPYALIISDANGTIRLTNKYADALYGYRREELIGSNLEMIIPEKRHASYEENMSGFFSSLEVVKLGMDEEMFAVRKDGTKFPIEVILTPIIKESETVVLSSVIDITERKTYETIIQKQVTELQSKNLELEQFNYISSHDLQEPLRTVSNYIQLLEEDYPELDDDIKTHLKTMDSAITRMSKIVRSLLDFGRLGRNKKIELTDCNEIVTNVINDLNSLIRNTNSCVTVSGELPEFYAYATELRQLFQNLINNAIKFSKKDTVPEIKISCTKHEDHYEFSVSDNGIGIEPKHFSTIFHIFQRLNKQEEYEGHGIGLANCKKIAEMHGGKIWVESHPGCGSTFKFTILNLKP